MITISIDDSNVIANLRGLPGKTRTRVKIGLRLGGMVIVNEAKENWVPVLSGNLKRSLHAEPVEVTPDVLTVRMGTNLEYAEKIEFGGSRKAPQGYMRPALDEKGNEAVQEIKESLMILLR